MVRVPFSVPAFLFCPHTKFTGLHKHAMPAQSFARNVVQELQPTVGSLLVFLHG